MPPFAGSNFPDTRRDAWTCKRFVSGVLRARTIEGNVCGECVGRRRRRVRAGRNDDERAFEQLNVPKSDVRISDGRAETDFELVVQYLRIVGHDAERSDIHRLLSRPFVDLLLILTEATERTAPYDCVRNGRLARRKRRILLRQRSAILIENVDFVHIHHVKVA